MREHPGESLYVVPICWTDRHAKLLGARFVELDPVVQPIPGERFDGWTEPTPTARVLTRDLSTLLSTESKRAHCKIFAIKNIMSTLYPEVFTKAKSQTDLDIYFGPRAFRKAIRVPVAWKYPESTGSSFDSAITRMATSFENAPASSGAATPGPSSPMLVYIGKSQLASIRQNLFRICPGPQGGDSRNTPVTNLQKLRSKHLIPGRDNHDAHFVGILLAMAQARFYGEPTSRASSQSSARSGTTIDMLPEKFHDVKVHLLTHSDDSTEFIVYKATVSATFLERFARPSKAPKTADGEAADPTSTGMKITFARVPIWPVLGLKERLGKALGPDLVSDDMFYSDDPEDMETWETKEERLIRNQRWLRRRQQELEYYRPRVKRRREEAQFIAEMLHSSFEFENDDPDEPESDDCPVISPRAKRRCARTGRASTLEVC